MKLHTKKELAARTLRVGRDRIWFNPERLSDIKEALTKQDIKDLVKEGMIKVKAITGRRKKQKRKIRRQAGKISKKVVRKREYVYRVRKIRTLLKMLKRTGRLTIQEYSKLNRYAKSGILKDIKQLRVYLSELGKNKKEEYQGEIK